MIFSVPRIPPAAIARYAHFHKNIWPQKGKRIRFNFPIALATRFWDSIILCFAKVLFVVGKRFLEEFGSFGPNNVNAGVAQLAEHNVANVVVVGSNPITRSF